MIVFRRSRLCMLMPGGFFRTMTMRRVCLMSVAVFRIRAVMMLFINMFVPGRFHLIMPVRRLYVTAVRMCRVLSAQALFLGVPVPG